MFNKYHQSINIRMALALVLLVGVFGVMPVRASADAGNITVSEPNFLNGDGTLKLDGSTNASFLADNWDVQLDPECGLIFSPKDREAFSPLADTTPGNWSALGSNLAGTDGALSDPACANHINHVKAAFGEQVAHEAMKKKGLEPLGKTDGIYEAGKNGIDGAYKNAHPPPDYVITEAKYGTSPLKKGLADESNQMDDFWVRQRLEEKVGVEQADLIKQAMDEGKVEKWVVRVDENGLRSVKKIDKNGNVILGNKGIVPGF